MIKKLITGMGIWIMVLFLCRVNVLAEDGIEVSLSGVGDRLILTVNPKGDTDLCQYSYDGGQTFVSQSFINVSELQVNSEGNVTASVTAIDTEGREYTAFVCISPECVFNESEVSYSVCKSTVNETKTETIPQVGSGGDFEHDSFDAGNLNHNYKYIPVVLISAGILGLIYVMLGCPGVYSVGFDNKKKYLGRALAVPGEGIIYLHVSEHLVQRAESNRLCIKFSFLSLLFLKYRFVEISTKNGNFESSVKRELYVDFYET